MHRSSEHILVTAGDAGSMAQAWAQRLGPGFDPVALRRLLELDPADPSALMRRLLILFVESLGAQSEALQAALNAAELDGMRRAAHAVRSPAMSMGATDFARACQALEQQVLGLQRAGSPPNEECLQAAATVLAGMGAMQRQLQRVLSSDPASEHQGHGRA